MEFIYLQDGDTVRVPDRGDVLPYARKDPATTESGTTGKLVDHGDGTYLYTFKKDITKDPRSPTMRTLTHRVGFEIRGLAQANNAAYTFQPSRGATTGIFSREIVDTATCDTCHTSLTAHGGARVEVQYCVMCQTPELSTRTAAIRST